MEERHLSLSEAAAALNISERTAYRWIKSGKLHAYKPGRDYWIPESAIEDVVKESEVRPKAPASSQPSFNGLLEEERRTDQERAAAAIEELRRVTEFYESLHAARDAVDEYRKMWEKRLDDEDLDYTAYKEAGRALKAFWPAVTTAADVEVSRLAQLGASPEEIERQAVLGPALIRFQALSERVNEAHRERFQGTSEATVLPFPLQEAG